MNIKIITASIRKGRIGPQISNWIFEYIQKNMQHDVEIIDLKKWNLPGDDEPYLPATGHYIQLHTQKWSKKIESGDLFIFVFPQYNWGYPAALKNAIDHLYHEWSEKPVLMVSYANRGGGKAANQLQQVAEGLHMHNLSDRLEISLKDMSFDSEGQLNQPIISLYPYEKKLNNLLFESFEFIKNKIS